VRLADHITDWVFGAICFWFLTRDRRQAPLGLYVFVIFLWFANLSFQACEHRVSNAEGEELGKPAWLCPGDNPLHNLKLLRFFGPATLNMSVGASLIIQRHGSRRRTVGGRESGDLSQMCSSGTGHSKIKVAD
jgi:hypothetical protein